MLQNLIQDLQSTLKNYSKGLENKNLLVEIPWTMVDGDLNLQRLIFNKDHSLYIVKDGDIQESKWEYLPAMNSLVVEIGGKKILLNSIFSDGKALILKKDGVNLNFIAFANPNEISDLDLEGYLKRVELLENNSQYISQENLNKQVQERYNQKYPGNQPMGCFNAIVLFVILTSIILLQ